MKLEERLKKIDEEFKKIEPAFLEIEGYECNLRPVIKDIKQFYHQAIKKVVKEVLKEVVPEKLNEIGDWVKSAQEKYNRDKRMFDDEPDREDLESALQAQENERSFNNAIDLIHQNIKDKLE